MIGSNNYMLAYLSIPAISDDAFERQELGCGLVLFFIIVFKPANLVINGSVPILTTFSQDTKLTFEWGCQRDDYVLGFSRPEKNLVVFASHSQQ